MAALLRCLRPAIAGHEIRRDSYLWWSRRERPAQNSTRMEIVQGLGFCNTLAHLGYCWLEPRIDWNQFTFQTSRGHALILDQGPLRNAYSRYPRQLQNFIELNFRLEQALLWLRECDHHDLISTRLLEWVAFLCLLQFRRDTMSHVSKEVRQEHRSEALEGARSFSYCYLNEILNNGPYLVSGNRSGFKNPLRLAGFLFNFGDGRIRQHWEHKPYRKLYQRAYTAVKELSSAHALLEIFTSRLRKSLFEYHWILPYPSADTFMPTTKTGQRMWYSINIPSEIPVVRNAKPAQWAWARGCWRPDNPSSFPRLAFWDADTWRDWIEQSKLERKLDSRPRISRDEDLSADLMSVSHPYHLRPSRRSTHLGYAMTEESD